MSRKIVSFIFCFFPAILVAQQKSDLQQVLERLDRIEQENKSLAEEVRALRAELAASRTVTPSPAVAASATPTQTPPIEERVEVNEQRIAEQAQSKVEASQKLPIVLPEWCCSTRSSTAGQTAARSIPLAHPKATIPPPPAPR